MFRFENPLYLYLLIAIPVLALLFYYSEYRRRRRLKTYGDPQLLRELMIDVSLWRPQLKMWLMLLALGSLIIVAARPQFGTKIDTSERNGIEAIIALDISNSMLANDVRPSRLDKAKMLVSNMVDDMKDDHVGLIVYAGEAFVQLPITNDYVSAKMFLEGIDPSLISLQGTDIRTAIELATKSFTQKKDISRAIFLITDGEDNEGGAVEAAREAAKKGMRVYVLGIGSPDGAHVPIPGTTQYFIDDQGNPVVSRLNEDMCRQIAKAGDGAYIYVDNSSSAQRELSKYVDKLAKAKLESQVYSEFDEQYQGFIILALVFLMIDICLLERKNHLLRNFQLFKRASAVVVLTSLFIGTAQAQSYRDYIRRGNRQYRDSIYDKAQVQYQKGFQLDSNSVQVRYNLGNTLLYQGQPKEAMQQYESAAAVERNPVRLHQIYHNLGVILQSQHQFGPAIQAYIRALAADPTDHESRYNLVLCQYQLQKDPQGGGGGQSGNDKKDEQKQEQQQQQKQEQQKQDQQQQQQRESEMSKENAEQMLNAAMQNERQTQDKVKKQQQQSQRRRLQKQW